MHINFGATKHNLVHAINTKYITIANREAGRINISTGGASLTFALNRNWMGGLPNSNLTSARFNIESQDNGVFIRTTFTGKYGINIRMHPATDKAFQVLGTDGTSVRYLVKANGQTGITTGAMAATDNAFQIGASSTVRSLQLKQTVKFTRVNTPLRYKTYPIMCLHPITI